MAGGPRKLHCIYSLWAVQQKYGCPLTMSKYISLLTITLNVVKFSKK